MEGKSVLFVGTKKQAQESIGIEAKRCNMGMSITAGWAGMTLPHHQDPYRAPERHRRDGRERGEFEVLPKEVIKLMAEREKLLENLGGIRG